MTTQSDLKPRLKLGQDGLELDRESPLSGGLLGLVEDLQSNAIRAPGSVDRLFEKPLIEINDAHIVVDILTESGAADRALAQLSSLGFENASSVDNVLSGRLPVAALVDVAGIPEINRVAASSPVLRAGSAQTLGDEAINADLARANFGVDGTGQVIGILSDSFDSAGGYAADIASGDLPANIGILDDSGGANFDVSDEGRALAQIIHDLAPGADLLFHTAFNGQADFADAIGELVDAGATIIIDDVGYRGQPFFQDDIIAQAVDDAAAAGVAYVSAAGNLGRDSHEQAFQSAGSGLEFYIDRHAFGQGDFTQSFTLAAGETVIFDFQWDEPFASAGAQGAASDIDFLILDSQGAILNNAGPTAIGEVTGGQDFNDDADAVELVSVENTTNSEQTYGIAIGLFSGPAPSLIKYNFEGPATITGLERAGTSFGHPSAEGALAIGAADYLDTPAFGQSPPLIQPFSSAGGPAGGTATPILFDAAGNRLATPQIRERVDFVAADGGDTTFFGTDRPEDANSFPNIFGTSAAAAHAAAAAALMREANPSLSVSELFDVLRETAIDMDDPGTIGFDAGYDSLSGHGLIDTNAAIQGNPDDFEPDNTDTNGTVAVGGNTNGSIEETSDQDWFALTLTAGEIYQINVAGIGDFDPYARLRASDGSLITQNNNSGPGSDARIDFAPTQTDTYFVAVNEAGFNDTGDYQVSVELQTPSIDDFEPDNTDTNGTVAVGGSTNGSIEETSDQDWFALTLTAGEIYQINVAGIGDFDPYARLRASDGSLITQNNNSGPGSDARIDFAPTQTDTYFVAVNEAGFNDTGDYQVSVELQTPSIDDFEPDNTDTNGTVAVGGSTNGSIEETSDQDWFALTLTAGEIYQINVAGIGDFDPYARLRASDGSLITQNNNSGPGSDARIDFAPTQTDTYFVAVNEAGFNDTGDYQVSVDQLGGIGIAAMPAPPLDIDSIVTPGSAV